MPGASSVASGNELFDILIYLTITPPSTITTATTTTGNVTVQGLVIGDYISWNQLASANANALVFVTNMYVSAANTLTITWGTAGATVTNAGSVPFLLEVVRSNIVPYTQLPNGIY